MSLNFRAPAQYSQRDFNNLIDQLNRELAKLLPRTEHIVMGIDQQLIIKSPDGHFWQISVSNLGALTTTDLGTGNPL
jgi:hypothetical protein